MTKLALCIGINDYGSDESNLSGCVNDATDWAAALTERGFAPRLLLDKDATGDQIREALRALMAAVKSGDRVVITYSGHGSFVPDYDGDEPDQQDECWCGADVISADAGIITDDEIKGLLSGRASGARVAVVSDSCFSGTITRHFLVGADPERRRIRYLHPAVFLPKEDLGYLALGKAPRTVSAKYPAVLLAGCQDTEYSYDAWFNKRPNGAFTRAALDTLPGKVSYRQWFAAIRKRLPSRDYPQTPNLDAGCWQKFWSIFS